MESIKIGEKTHSIVHVDDKIYCKVQVIDGEGNILDTYKIVESPEKAQEYYTLVQKELINRETALRAEIEKASLQLKQYNFEIAQISLLLED